MSEYGLQYLTQAKAAYSFGNIKSAKDLADQAIGLLQNKEEYLYEYFDSITLLQSIAANQRDYDGYQALEPLIKDCTYRMFHDLAPSYYALHQYDASEFYGNLGLLADAAILIKEANTFLMDTYGEDLLLKLMYHHYDAKLSYRLEDFYSCVENCLEANRLWTLLGDFSHQDHPFLTMLYANLNQIDRLGIMNLILLSSTYGKLNNCEPGIEILNNLKTIDITDFYIQSAIDLNLAERYSRTSNFNAAMELIRPYQNANYDNYPDLAACIDTIQFLMYYRVGLQNQAIHLLKERMPLSQTISKDYLKIHRYNLALVLAEQKNYKESLSLSFGLGEKGFSLQMALYLELQQWDKIQAAYSKVCKYYLNEIQNIFLHYNEELVFQHLEALEYHLSLCMGAFIECSNAGSESTIPAGDLYDFCLNIKGISLEGSYLIRHYPDPTSIKNRGLYRLKDLQKNLSEDTLLLDYCILKTLNASYYGVFLVSRNDVICLKLNKEEEINTLISKYRTYLSMPAVYHERSISPDDVTTLEMKLRRSLILPIKKFLNNYRHLIIAPAGELFHLPFELLTLSHGKELGQSYDISYINMGRELAFHPPSKAISQKLETLIIGNPSNQSLPSLPFAEIEAEIVGKQLGSPVYLGKDANYEIIIERSPNLGLLQIATHGIYPTPDTSSFPYKMNGRKRCSNYIMEECGLLLAEDYLLTADEISMLPLTYVNLCVLSACDSGLGSIENYEGSFGIRRAFFLAGCKSLLVCLWKINDLSSMLFFSCFYHELAQEDVSSLEALNRAKQILRNRTVAEWKPYLAHIQKNYNFTDLDHAFKDVLNQHDSYIPFKHPYYWAGFILIGSATKPDHILHR